MKWAPNKRLHFEIGVIKAVQELGETNLSDVLSILRASLDGQPVEALTAAVTGPPAAMPSLPAAQIPAPAAAAPQQRSRLPQLFLRRLQLQPSSPLKCPRRPRHQLGRSLARICGLVC